MRPEGEASGCRDRTREQTEKEGGEGRGKQSRSLACLLAISIDQSRGLRQRRCNDAYIALLQGDVPENQPRCFHTSF